MYFLKRNKILLEKITEYFTACTTDIEAFEEAINHFIAHGNDSSFEKYLQTVRHIEQEADSILHHIEKMLYKKSLLPESREDLMRLLERYDDIVDCTNHILRFLFTRNTPIPGIIVDDIRKMIALSTRCYLDVKIAIEDLLGKRLNIREYISAINEYESACDDIQSQIIRVIFSSRDIRDFDKIILTDLVNIITKITDYCEDAADLITIINIKRVV